MTDDLKARLRREAARWQCKYKRYQNEFGGGGAWMRKLTKTFREAADRIEELERERDEAVENFNHETSVNISLRAEAVERGCERDAARADAARLRAEAQSFLDRMDRTAGSLELEHVRRWVEISLLRKALGSAALDGPQEAASDDADARGREDERERAAQYLERQALWWSQERDNRKREGASAQELTDCEAKAGTLREHATAIRCCAHIWEEGSDA